MVLLAPRAPQKGFATGKDKSSFCGGNSTKATSGINGAGDWGSGYLQVAVKALSINIMTPLRQTVVVVEQKRDLKWEVRRRSRPRTSLTMQRSSLRRLSWRAHNVS